jgi:hypothetical protein
VGAMNAMWQVVKRALKEEIRKQRVASIFSTYR